ncbi:hypothetical protein EDF58_102298 [Novosphingobium sp. PhB57]|uniref:hypothetical protein n=1 Tax=unclassified Novosphingobium TaxID=2644732 RepID=UPI00105348CE|nr:MULTISPECIES: hypothetical protein [unclassified Novosphingobium]TCU59614.1 hypothetical protein EDF58_102298 [Novosphingobium sp. PhB57]TDW63721.1 hypothetical protein EDF57_105194 [Novosphingobium sp. PhB55]
MRTLCFLIATLSLAACGQSDPPGPDGVTVGEARALDEAAEMFDARPEPASTSAPTGAAATQAE